MPLVRVSVLGPTRVHDAGGEPIEITRDAQRRVLTLLAIDAGQPVSTESLIDRFWNGDPPASARGALQTHISSLRRLLPEGSIRTLDTGYSIDTEVIDVDAHRLRAIAAAAGASQRNGDWSDVLARAREAWTLPSGVPFEELPDDERAATERSAIEAIRSTIDESGVDALIRAGDFAEALPRAETLVGRHPLRERGWELVARARSGLDRHAEALRAIQDARTALVDAGLVPSAALRRTERLVLAAADRPRGNLTYGLTSFVGRQRELAAAGRALDDHRLVTLVGPGGVGKSRLALETARRRIDTGAIDECWVVELATLDDPADIAGRIVEAMQLRRDERDGGDDAELAAAAIGTRSALIVLDNCEHLVDGAADTCRAILSSAPNVRVLATSRQQLDVGGECRFEVPPLTSGAGDDGPASDDRFADAVQLFVDRVRLRRAEFRPTTHDIDAIARLCVDLDGLPLAIELAAARAADDGIDLLAADIREQIAQPSGPNGPVSERHRTMRAAIEWSVALLEPAAAEHFPRLGIFRGRFGLDAVAEVCDLAADDAAAVMRELIDAALVARADRVDGADGVDRVDRDSGGPTFELLDTVRSVALELLPDAEAAGVRRRLRSFLATRCAELRWFWVQPPERRVQPTMHRWWLDQPFSMDDVAAALTTTDDDIAGTADLAGLLGHVAAAEGRHRAAVRLLATSVSATTDTEVEAMTRSLLAVELTAADEFARAGVEFDRAVELVADAPPSFARVLVLARAALATLVLPGRPPVHGIAPALDALESAAAVGAFARWRIEALVATMFARIGDRDAARRHLNELVDGGLPTPDAALEGLVITAAINVTTLADDIDGLTMWLDRALDYLAEHPDAASGDLGTWLVHEFGRLARFDDAEVVIRLASPVEGYELSAVTAMRARLAWLSGDAATAATMVDAAFDRGADSFWEPQLCATGAEAFAELGWLHRVRATADRLGAVTPSDGTDLAQLGVVRPLVRAHVDRALRSTGDDRAAHERAAREALASVHEICDAAPAEAAGAVGLETVEIYRSLADAEVSRLDDRAGAIDAWRSLVPSLRTTWFRRYAERRIDELVALPDG